MATGARRQLQPTDMVQLDPTLHPSNTADELWRTWSKQVKQALPPGRPLEGDGVGAAQHPVGPRPGTSLLRAAITAFGGPYFAAGFLKLFEDALSFVGPLLLGQLVAYLDSHAKAESGSATLASAAVSWDGWSLLRRLVHIWHAIVASWSRTGPYFGYWCAGVLGLTALLKAILSGQFGWQMSRCSCRLRSALLVALHRKALAVRLGAEAGELQTLMSVDTGRVVGLLGCFHALWSLPLQIAVALVLLYTQVRFAFVACVVVILLVIPINCWITMEIQRASVTMMTAKDARVAAAAEMLRGMRAVKMLGWEPVLTARIEAERKVELRALAVEKYLDALCVYFWAATSLLFSILTFGLVVLLGQPLTPSAFVTSLALFQSLLWPLNAFPWVINGVVEAGVSLGRIRRYLLAEEVEGGMDIPDSKGISRRSAANGGPPAPPPSAPLASASPQTPAGDAAAVFVSATLAWGPSAPPCLRDVSVAIPWCAMTAVVGPVGAGKSSLLAALLGELHLVSGSLCPPRCRAAYVGQRPWLLAGTLRDNVLLGAPLEQERYSAVLRACALLPDLGQMVAGDLTRLGDRGATLSGGQQARVALARALYARCPLLLLDDVLAAVDARCAAWLIQEALLGPVVAGTTIVMATKSLPCIQAAALVLHLDHGTLHFAGSASDYLASHRQYRTALQQQPLPALAGAPDPSEAPLGPLDPAELLAQSAFALREEQASYATSTGALSPRSASASEAAYATPRGTVSPRSSSASETFATPKGALSPRSNASAESSIAVATHGGLSTPPPDLDAFETPPSSPPSELLPHQNGIREIPANGSVYCTPSSSRAVSMDPLLGGEDAAGSQRAGGGAPQTEGASQEESEEEREVGHVKWPVYVAYMAAIGKPVVAIVLLSLVLMQVTENGNDLWIAHWVSSRSRHSSDTQRQAPDRLPSGDRPPSATCTVSLAAASSRILIHTLGGGAPRASPQRDWCLSFGASSMARMAQRNASTLLLLGSSACAAPPPTAPNHTATDPPTPRDTGTSPPPGATGSPPGSATSAPNSQSVTTPTSTPTSTPTPTTTATATSHHASGIRAGLPPASGASSPTPTHVTELTSSHMGGPADGAATVLEGQAAAGEPDGQLPEPNRKLLSSTPGPRLLARLIPQRHADLGLGLRPDGWVSPQSSPLAAHAIGGQPLGERPPLDADERHFLKVLLMIGVANLVATMARAFSFAFAGLRAAREVHSSVLATLLAAPMAFFDSTPSGRLLNRFSSDVSTVDGGLPFQLNILLANIVSMAGVLVVLCYSQPLLLGVLLPLGLVYRALQVYYRSSSRELRRLNAVSLSPLSTAFQDVAEGALSIRAYQLQGSFHARLRSAVADNQSVDMTGSAASTWLEFRLQLLAASLVTALAALAVVAHEHLLPGSGLASAGLVGLALSYALPITGLLSGLLTSSAQTEQEMVAVERLGQLLKVQGQADTLPPIPGVPKGSGRGPSVPHIELWGVYMRYAPGLPWALQGVDLQVPRGHRLGVVGRTGAGKSSLAAVMLRLSEVEAGVIRVNGRDVRGMPLAHLRAIFAAVPQTPLLFRGSVRSNLDPLGRCDDAELAHALQAVSLLAPLQRLASHKPGARPAAPPGVAPSSVGPRTPLLDITAGDIHDLDASRNVRDALEYTLGDNGSGLSAGQAQLLCLARALLRGAEVLLLDEATACVDAATARLMADVLRERLGGSSTTIIQIAHNLAAVADYDEVAVMSAGRVVELGTPNALLQEPSSQLAMLMRAAAH